MRLAIFGGTGRTGQHLLHAALEAGYPVNALARTPAKLRIEDDRLAIVQGKLSEADCIDQVIAGSGAVISVLGPSSSQPVFEISQGTQAIIQSMKSNGVKRLIVTTGAGVGDPDDAPTLFNRLMVALLKATSKNVYEDMLKTVSLVRESGLDWTVVRVPMLTDSPASGKVKVGMIGKGTGARLSRADMAGFLLQQVESRQYLCKAPAISN